MVGNCARAKDSILTCFWACLTAKCYQSFYITPITPINRFDNSNNTAFFFPRSASNKSKQTPGTESRYTVEDCDLCITRHYCAAAFGAAAPAPAA